MSDIKDILGVSRGGAAASDRPSDAKPKKEKAKKMERPQGMSREAFALLDDSHPIISSQLIASNLKTKDAKAAKPKPSTKGIPTWQWKPFKNAARTDDLELCRWIKGYKDLNGHMREPDDSDYFYAKFNKKAQMMRYSEEEWESIIKGDSGDWSRQETDYLFDLCDRFDLRFSIVADRYEWPDGPARTVDDMKERYYYVARKLLIAREGSEGAVSNHPLVRNPFNKAAEVERKKALEMLLVRTAQQTEEENAILAEARKIEEQHKAEAAAAAAAAGAHKKSAQTPAGRAGSGSLAGQTAFEFPTANFKFPLDYSVPLDPETPSLFDADMNPTKPPKPGVFGRGSNSIAVALAMNNSLPGQKGSKSVEQILSELGWVPALYGPKCNTRAVCGSWLALRAEVVALVELRRQVHNRIGGGDVSEKKTGKGGKKRALGS